jgi:hypothetical protein
MFSSTARHSSGRGQHLVGWAVVDFEAWDSVQGRTIEWGIGAQGELPRSEAAIHRREPGVALIHQQSGGRPPAREWIREEEDDTRPHAKNPTKIPGWKKLPLCQARQMSEAAAGMLLFPCSS